MTPSVRVEGTRPMATRTGRTLGYVLSATPSAKSDAHPTQVTRAEEEIKAFHAVAVAKLSGAGAGSPADVERRLDFPLKEFKTGFEMVPGLVFAGALVASVHQAEMDLVPAAGFALALSSLAMLFVMAFGMARLPVTWAGSKRVEPLQAYLARVAAELDARGLGDELAALVEPPLVEDWPSRVGDIDLSVHDLPHDSSATEWWYYNAHLIGTSSKSGSTKRLSFFASFFRVIKHVDERGNKYHGHALTWAISDATTGEYHFDVTLEGDAPKTILSSLEKGYYSGPSDAFVRRALVDVLKKGNVPKPDRLMSRDPVVSRSQLSLDFAGSTLTKDESTGEYLLRCFDEAGAATAELRFAPQKKPVRHGDHGVVKGHAGRGEDMFYYFIPRCAVSGTLTLPRDEATYEVHGEGWYDHEFGGMYNADQDNAVVPEPKRAAERHDYAWNWVAVQLDDGTEVTAAKLFEPRAKRVIETKAVLVAKDGSRAQHDETVGTTLEEVDGERWTSVRSFKAYPIAFRLVVPPAEMDLVIRASFPDQEFMTILSKPAFWEGRCDVTGTVKGRRVTGLAYLERNGFDPDVTLSSFFKNVGIAVRDSVAACYPTRPTLEEAVHLCATPQTRHYLDDVPLDILGENLMGPVRLIADRGGKSWRSYAALACIDAVGGDSRKFVQWVAMPEFLHVGSLIVDDIQDKSETRRGGPCAHHVYGEPLCINAGTAAYFQCESLLDVPGMSAQTRLECYKLYFAALRGGHAGQCLDIYGNDYLMDDVVATGDASLLEKRIIAIHRLKTAVPAGTLARLGCTVGGGTPEQIESVGLFMEAVGVAFQIMDDVLNLRGIYGSKADKVKANVALKTVGEDISDGKITYPVAKYLGRVKDADARKKLWDTIRSKPQDRDTVDAVIAELERVGAIEDCVVDANAIVANAWSVLDAKIPDSFAKMMLRSFGMYVVEQSGG